MDPILISTCDADEQKRTDYLELCRFIMRDANPECNGILIRGSSMFEEKALELLYTYNFNYDLAVFHILHAEQMAIPILKTKYLELFSEEPNVLTRVVQEKLMELKGCNND